MCSGNSSTDECDYFLLLKYRLPLLTAGTSRECRQSGRVASAGAVQTGAAGRRGPPCEAAVAGKRLSVCAFHTRSFTASVWGVRRCCTLTALTLSVRPPPSLSELETDVKMFKESLLEILDEEELLEELCLTKWSDPDVL